MCGFAGVHHADGRIPEALLLERVAGSLSHRGPDGQGVWFESSIGFAHRRLAIIDRTQAGLQPMISADGRWVLAFNGEIYNYKELRSSLAADFGVAFRSRTDTEVLLEGIANVGLPGFIRRCNGDFAFAVWDRRERELHLARDRFGVKPLYYARRSGDLVFGSEIKSLLGLGFAPEADLEALDSYLQLRYCAGPETAFKGIRRVSPGTVLSYDGSELRELSYWELGQAGRPVSIADASQGFYELLEDSVKLRLESDVPVATLLSAGIDSSAVSSIASRYSQGIEAYTYSMSGTRHDEFDQARAVARAIGVSAHRVSHELEDFLLTREALLHLEEPIGDSIIVPALKLFRETAKTHRVALSGEGADEIASGYVHHFVLSMLWRLESLLGGSGRAVLATLIREIPVGIIQRIFPYPGKVDRASILRLAQVVREGEHPVRQLLNLFSVFDEKERRALMPGLSGVSRSSDVIMTELWESLASDRLNRLQTLDLRFWNPDYSMLRIDKLSMARALEIRVPFLDHRLVEHALGLPPSLKQGPFSRKVVLRRSLKGRGLIPEETRKGKKKPFQLPVDEAYGTRFREYTFDTLGSSAVSRSGFLDPEAVTKVRNQGFANLRSTKRIVNLLHLVEWSDLFLKGTAPTL